MAKQSESTLTTKYVRNAQHFDEQRGALFVEMTLGGIQDPFALNTEEVRPRPKATVNPISVSLNNMTHSVAATYTTPLLSSYMNLIKSKAAEKSSS